MAVWSEVKTSDIFDSKRIDGEFYHPNYIKSENIVLRSKSVTNLGKIGDFLIGPFGSAFHVSNYDNTSPYRYVRGKDVKPFALLKMRLFPFFWGKGQESNIDSTSLKLNC